MQCPPPQGLVLKTIRSFQARTLPIPLRPLWFWTPFPCCKPAGPSLSVARAPLCLLGGARGAISLTASPHPPPSALRPPPSATARRRRRPAGPAPAPAKGAAKAKPGAPRSPGTRPPSRRWAPNGRAALGPSASPHVAPPHAALSLAVARPSGPAPLLEAGQTAPQPGAGLEVNGPE